MTPRAFFKLVEIRTKAASLLPYVAGTLYAVYRFDAFNSLHAVLMLVSLLSIDLATTALNNYKEGVTQHSVLHFHGTKYSKSSVRRLMIFLLLVGALSGGYLAALTGPVVWGIGVLAFLTGIAYSAGPLPIQRTPFGEIFSGIAMGFGIFFLACFIHLEGDAFQVYTFGRRLMINISLDHLGALLVLGFPFAAAIANVMLANNISDMAEDFASGRYTLPVIIGRTRALLLFNLLYVAAFLAVILAAVLKQLPLTALLMVFPFALVMVYARRFSMAPDKEKTFPLAVRSLNLIGGGLILVIGSGILLKL